MTEHAPTKLANVKLPVLIRQSRMGYLHDYVVALLLIAGATALYVFQPLAFLNYVALGLGIIALFLLIIVELHVMSHTLTIDEEKVRITHGVLARSNRSAAFHNVTDFHSHQTFHERLLGYGTLEISTSGSTEPLEFHKVRHPHKVCDVLLHLSKQHVRSHDAHHH